MSCCIESLGHANHCSHCHHMRSGWDNHGRRYQNLNDLDSRVFTDIEYNPLLSPLAGICRIMYGTFQITGGSIILAFAPITGATLLTNGVANLIRGSIGSIPLFGGPVLYLYDKSVGR